MAKLKIVGLRLIHHKIALQSQKSYIDLTIVIKPMKSPHDDLFLNIKKKLARGNKNKIRDHR